MYTDEIMHYGVLGMKWGVRKKREPNPRRQAKKEFKARRKADRKMAYQDVNRLSTQELRDRTNRNQAEEAYLKSLGEPNPVAKRFVDAVIVGSIVGVASSRVQGGLNKGIDKGIDFVAKKLRRS